MAKRFTATDIWGEDWFLDMPIEYKLFWYYMLSVCDHSGLFKVNLRSFCGLNGVKVAADKALAFFNTDKQRIRVVNPNLWLVEDFFVFQYGSHLNEKNKVHKSIKLLWEKHGINLTSIRGLKEVNDTLKDKEQDKDIVIKEEGAGETIKKFTRSDTGLIFNAEEEILGNRIEFEKISTLLPSGTDVEGCLKKYHLWMLEKDRYPIKRQQVYAGFHRWALNEKNFLNNGTHQQAPTKTGKQPGESSNQRMDGISKWGFGDKKGDGGKKD